jgi:hypothetical protein
MHQIQLVFFGFISFTSTRFHSLSSEPPIPQRFSQSSYHFKLPMRWLTHSPQIRCVRTRHHLTAVEQCIQGCWRLPKMCLRSRSFELTLHAVNQWLSKLEVEAVVIIPKLGRSAQRTHLVLFHELSVFSRPSTEHRAGKRANVCSTIALQHGWSPSLHCIYKFNPATPKLFKLLSTLFKWFGTFLALQ